MGGASAVWLIAGGEPGAERFGQLVQRLRKEKHMSVEELAHDSGLSVGTIRAIEQARRAPSEESGLRLLQLLLPEGSLSVEPKANSGSRETGPDIAFLDPESGTKVLLEFKAKKAGDNRRWSIDKPRAGESKVEAALRELMADDTRRAELQRELGAALTQIAEIASQATRPASDAAIGRIVRRLPTTQEYRVEFLEKLMDLWDRVDNGTADEWDRHRNSEVFALLERYQFPDEDVAASSE